MMTHRQILDAAVSKLLEAGIMEASNDAGIIFEEAFQMNRTSYLIRANEEVNESLIPVFDKMINRRAAHEPLQYILGKAYFMGLEFMVSPDVLIPRFDTEILVEEALKHINSDKNVLDVCTGSGCIAISVAKLSNAKVVAVDISEAALNMAKKNAEYNETSNVTFIHSDMFSDVEGKFDVILSNPPYIRSEEVLKLMPEVLVHEPHLALDGHEDGLFFYEILARESSKFLNPSGLLIMEIGYDQAEDVSRLLENNNFTDIRVIRDLAGLDRVVCGWRK